MKHAKTRTIRDPATPARVLPGLIIEAVDGAGEAVATAEALSEYGLIVRQLLEFGAHWHETPIRVLAGGGEVMTASDERAVSAATT